MIHFRLLLNTFKIGNVSNVTKRQFIAKQAARNNIKTLIETGTYFGHSTMFFSKKFTKVFTIEISKGLFDFTSKKFLKHQNICNFLGDSSLVLKNIIEKLDTEAIFFLDGHASGGVTGFGDKASPAKEELAILASFTYLPNSMIFIDDAVGFDGTNSYPSLDEIESWALKNGLDKPKVEFDMIVIYPRP